MTDTLKPQPVKPLGMRCVICDSTNKWENVDGARIKPMGMSICGCCGFISYPAKWQSPEEIRSHYKTNYRTAPTSANLYSCQRKNNFHNVFLQEVFQGWQAAERKPKIFEVGAASGMALDFIRKAVPGAQVSGSELTTSFVRTAWHEYGIELKDDFDESQKYDMIMSYKVAEHQLDIDKELLRYRKCLTSDGMLYIAVPTWFDTLSNFGMQGFDLEYYYDPNHINVWTRKLFESLLKKCGFKIVKEDHVMYDSSYICVVDPDWKGVETQVEFELVSDIKQKLMAVKNAFFLVNEQQYDDAIKIWPNYPAAHANKYEMMRKEAFANGWPWIKQNIIIPFITACPLSTDPYVLATDFAMRADQWDEAVKFAQVALKMKPENPMSLGQLVNIMREMGLKSEMSRDNKAAVHYFTQAREIAIHLRNVSPQHYKEATDQIFLFDSHLPIPSEAAHAAPN